MNLNVCNNAGTYPLSREAANHLSMLHVSKFLLSAVASPLSTSRGPNLPPTLFPLSAELPFLSVLFRLSCVCRLFILRSSASGMSSSDDVALQRSSLPELDVPGVEMEVKCTARNVGILELGWTAPFDKVVFTAGQ